MKYVFIISIMISIIILVGYLVLKSPFKYPYYEKTFDVSGKKQPSIYDLIDNYLNANRFNDISRHYQMITNWKKKTEEEIEKSILRKFRWRQYQSIVDDTQAFCFKLIRKQTRYKQTNYVKTPYYVYVIVEEKSFDFEFLQNRFNILDSIHFECTLSEYHSKKQRKRMTKDLRLQIMQRDNYTCKYCGKYMPDEVGLQIDHIIPIAKGGKSISSNLQVLCSKCNGRKSKN